MSHPFSSNPINGDYLAVVLAPTITDYELKTLPSKDRITHLDISHCRFITSAGIRYLKRCPVNYLVMTKLPQLDDVFVEEICTIFPKIVQLTINRNTLSVGMINSIAKIANLTSFIGQRCDVLLEGLIEICSLKSLHHLDISYNSIEEAIPLTYLEDMTTLRSLELVECLATTGTRGLSNPNSRPGEISFVRRMRGLTKLNLLGCEVITLDYIRDLPNLTELNISGYVGDDTDFAQLGSMVSLTNLDISNSTQLTGEAMNTISKLTNMKRLILSFCKFTELDFYNLLPLKKLEELDISYMPYSVNILTVLLQFSKLKILRLASTSHYFPPSHIENLFHFPTLRELYFSCTSDEDLVSEEKGNAMEKWKGESKLDILFIYGVDISNTLIKAIGTLPHLKSLDIGYCTGYTTLADLAKLDNLTALSVNNSGVEDFSFIRQLPRLTKLNVSFCSGLDGDDWQYIASLPNLAVLDCSSCPGLTATVMKMLATATITELYLNDCTNVGEEAAESFPTMGNLQILSILNCNFHDPSVLSILSIPRLYQLYLTTAKFSPEGLKKLRKRAEINPSP